MEGWVSKKRPTGVGKFKIWQKRFLVCNSEHLSYFGENERKKPKAQFRLNEIESVSLVVSEKKPDHTRFDIVCRPGVVVSVKGASEKETMKRVYSFRATTADEAKKWVSTINSLAFGESIDVNGDIIDLTKPDFALGLRGEESVAPRLAASSAPPEAANLREVICDRIYNALNISAILSPSAALTLDTDGTRGSVKPTFLSSGGYLCSNENNTEEHLKMMIYNELGSDTDLLRFLCGQFYTLICSGNRDGFDSRSRAHSFSASVSQTAPEASSPPPSSPTLRSPVVKCALKTCKNMRCRLPGFLGFRAALEPRPGAPQQLFCTEHAELWARASQACAKSLQTPLLGELLEQPPDVLVHELITALANGTPDAKGVACRLLWVVLPVYLEHKAKHKRRAHEKIARRDERSGSEAPSVSEGQDEYENSESNLPRLSLSLQNSTHQRQLSATSEQRLSLSTLSPLPPLSPRFTDMAALEETSVVRTVALKTLPKQFAALMSQHCSGQEYSLPIKNALTSIMLRPSARMLKPEDLDIEEQAAMHMVVNHDGACWLAFMVALKAAPFNLREQALKEVNMLLIENPGNCSNFKRQRNWPWLIYSLMSDIPASILGLQTAEEHEELTKQRESGLLSNVLPVGRDFPSLSFSLSSNSDDSNPPTPQPRSPLAPLVAASPLATSSTTTTASVSAAAAVHATTPTINPPHNPSVIAPPIPIPETPTPPNKQPPPPPPLPSSSNSNSSSSSSSSNGSDEASADGGGSKKNSLKFSFEQQQVATVENTQPKRGSLTKVKMLSPLPPLAPSPTFISTSPAISTSTSSSAAAAAVDNKPRRRLSQSDDMSVAVVATHENGHLQPKRGSLKKLIHEDTNVSNNGTGSNSNSFPSNPPTLPSLSISITDLTPLSLRLHPDDPEDQIDPELIAATHAACAEEAKSPKGGAAPTSSISVSVNASFSEQNKAMLNNNNNRRKGAVFVHKGAGGTLPFRNNNQRGTSPSRYGTLSGAFAIHRKGEEKNEAEEHNKLIVRVYTYSLNIMTILQYDSAIHSSSTHFKQLMLRCLNALLSCTKEDKARTLMRTMFITLSTKLGSKKILDRNQLNSLAWQNVFPFFELIRTFLFQTFTFNVLEEAKIRGISHDRKKTMSKNPPTSVLPSSSSSRALPAPFAAWGHEEGYMVDLLPGVDVMADSETRRITTAGGESSGVDDAVLGFENGEYGFHLDAPGYYGDIALAERCAYLLRCKGVDVPVDESLPGVTVKDIAILREAHSWYEFFEDATELLKMLPLPTPAEKGDTKTMSDRLALFDNIMEGKTLKKFCEVPKEARRTMLKKIKEGPKPSRNPFATPRRSKNNIVIDLSGGPKSPTAK